MRLVVKNGRVVTSTGVVHGGLVSDDGVIIHIGPNRSLPANGETIDARGNWIPPGVIDPHAHIGTGPAAATMDRLLKQWESESRGAVHKGVTTILSFQGGSPNPMAEPHIPMLHQQIAWAEQASYADFGFHAIMQTEIIWTSSPDLPRTE